jgi:hypothetical protein
LKTKKIGPCKIHRRFTANAYEIEFPDNDGISLIFDVTDLYPYKRDEAGESNDQKQVHWEEQLSTTKKPQMEKIIEQRDGKKTRRKTYPEYLAKQKDHPMEYASWITKPNILKRGKIVQELMNMIP